MILHFYVESLEDDPHDPHTDPEDNEVVLAASCGSFSYSATGDTFKQAANKLLGYLREEYPGYQVHVHFAPE